MKRETIEKLTVKRLLNFKIGEEVEFRLPSAMACHSGKSLVYYVRRMTATPYSCATDFSENCLTVKRL